MSLAHGRHIINICRWIGRQADIEVGREGGRERRKEAERKEETNISLHHSF